LVRASGLLEQAMKETIEALTAFANTVKNNRFGAIAAIVLVIVLALSLYLLANVNARINHNNPPPSVEAARFDRANKATAQITELLDSKVESLNASRAGIRQFHNGKTDLSGLPFMYVSTTFVRTREGIAFPESNYQQVPASTITEMTSAMWADYRHPKCIVVDSNTELSSSYRRYLEDLQVEVFYACPISNLQMYPVGFMFVSYVKGAGERPSDEEILETVEASAARISGYLASVTRPETHWWKFWERKPDGK
jgi:hypothetical protein